MDWGHLIPLGFSNPVCGLLLSSGQESMRGFAEGPGQDARRCGNTNNASPRWASSWRDLGLWNLACPGDLVLGTRNDGGRDVMIASSLLELAWGPMPSDRKQSSKSMGFYLDVPRLVALCQIVMECKMLHRQGRWAATVYALKHTDIQAEKCTSCTVRNTVTFSHFTPLLLETDVS